MKKVLVIAPEYCRSNSPNGQLERRFFSHLPQSQYTPLILCNAKWNLEEPTNCKIVRTPFNKWIDYTCRFLFHSPFPHIGNVPDKEYYCWGRRAVDEALKLADRDHFDIIHSISMPCSSHVVAYEIKKRLNIPWVAQFYDPWSGNPFRVMKSNKMQELDRFWEREVARCADLIIHPCNAMIDYWHSLFGDLVKDKMMVLPFVAEIPAFEVKPHSKQKIVISHIGNFSNNRNASVFIQALSKLDNETRNRIEVVFVGNVVESDIRLIQKYSLENVIRLVGRLPENECQKYYEESDMFLIVDINCSPNLFYPSKILKYYCYKKPIMGITTDQSVIRDELVKTGNYAFSYNDVCGIASFLKKTVRNYESVLTNDIGYGMKFSINNVIGEYCQLIRRLLA